MDYAVLSATDQWKHLLFIAATHTEDLGVKFFVAKSLAQRQACRVYSCVVLKWRFPLIYFPFFFLRYLLQTDAHIVIKLSEPSFETDIVTKGK